MYYQPVEETDYYKATEAPSISFLILFTSIFQNSKFYGLKKNFFLLTLHIW